MHCSSNDIQRLSFSHPGSRVFPALRSISFRQKNITELNVELMFKPVPDQKRININVSSLRPVEVDLSTT